MGLKNDLDKKFVKAVISVITLLCVAFIGNKAYAETNISSIASCEIFDTIQFGSYEQDGDETNGPEPIEWIVLSKENGRVLVISKYALDVKPYEERQPEATWAACSLRRWLNKDFLKSAFSEDERLYIPIVTVNPDTQPDCDIDPGIATNDRVFLLSRSEVGKYFASDEERRCKPTEYAVSLGANSGAYSKDDGYCQWMLRTPGYFYYGPENEEYNNSDVPFVNSKGQAETSDNTKVFYEHIGLRPAIWICSEKQEESTNTDKRAEQYAAAIDLINKGEYKDAIALLNILDGYAYSLNNLDRYADDGKKKINEIKKSPYFLKECEIGDTFLFGSFEQDADETNGPEPIEWVVLTKENERVLVISKYGLEVAQNIKGATYEALYTDESSKWENSVIRQWMNGEFLNTAFSAGEQNVIPLVTVPAHRNPKSDKNPGNDTEDKIFSLSIEEAEQYFSSNKARICKPTKYSTSKWGCYCSSFWYLRSPGSIDISTNAYVRSNGEIDYRGFGDDGFRIRPAMWIDVEKYDGLGVKNFFDTYQELEDIKYMNLLQNGLGDYYFYVTKNNGNVEVLSSKPVLDSQEKYGTGRWHDVKKIVYWVQPYEPAFALTDSGDLLISENAEKKIKCEIPERAMHGIKDIIRSYGSNQLIIMFEDGTAQTFTLNQIEQKEGNMLHDMLDASKGIRSYSLDLHEVLAWIDGDGRAFSANVMNGEEYSSSENENLERIWRCTDDWHSITIARRRDGSTVVVSDIGEYIKNRIEALYGIKDVHLTYGTDYLTILFDDGTVMIERFFCGPPTERYDMSSIRTADRILVDYLNPIIIDSDGNTLDYSLMNSENVKVKRSFDTHGYQLKDAFMIIDDNKSREYFGLTTDGHIIKIDVIEEPY